MARNFAEIAFTDAVKSLQQQNGSRKNYERMEKLQVIDGLTINEANFIAERDSFYIATIGENSYPYIQHRGGPKGFLKVLNTKKIAFIDFSGNKQYVSVGNLSTNNNVALIMVDYPTRSRLKIFAKAEIVGLSDDSELISQLDLGNYKFRPERILVFHIEAYDWNCPQHITPRYTIEEIEEAFAPQRNYIIELESEVKKLKETLKRNQIDKI